MVEMLVAMAATLIMVLFLNQIFGSLSNATSMGKGTSVIVQNARIIAPQIANDDGQNMVGPADGVLVIINRLIPGDLNGDGDALDAGEMDLRLTPDSGGPIVGGLRSDQVMWVRTIDLEAGERGRTPTGVYNFSNGTNAAYARIWYGHLLRTTPGGASPPGADLGIPNTTNQYPVNWLFGRQALFLFDGAPGGSVHSQGGWYDAPVVGYGTGSNASPYLNSATYVPTPAPAGHHGPLYMGLTDRALFGFNNEATSGAMVGNSTVPETYPNPPSRPRLYENMPAAAYRDAAYNYTFAFERLRVNPSPVVDAGIAGGTYKAWQFAQMHPFLADRVIEFAVDFAGDYVGNDGLLDTTGGAIQWYGQYPNAAAGVQQPPAALGAGALAPIWDNRPPGTPGKPPHVNGAFIFRHGGGPAQTNWPYLLRFRYRLIDAQGRLTGADQLPGKLFEQIVRVNDGRP